MNAPTETISFDQLRRILRRRRWFIVPFVVVGAVAGVLLAQASPRENTATSTVLIDSGTGGGSGPGRLSAPVAARVLRTRAIAERVRVELSDRRSISELLAAVSAQPDDSNAFLNITARDDTSAARAATLANAFAKQFIASRSEIVRARAQDAIATAERQLARLPPASPERSSLGTRLAQLRANATLGAFDAELIDPAVPGGAATGGSPVRWGVAGAGLGLLLGLVLAFSAEAIDPRVRRSEELRRLVDAPQLAALPLPRRRSRRRQKPLVLREGREPFDRLRAALLVLARKDGARRMIVTSATHRSEGAATVAANVAVSLARLGMRVCVVDTDLREPALASHFGLDDGAPGLADAIRGMPLSQAVQRFAIPAENAIDGNRAAEPIEISVMAAGSGSGDDAAQLLTDPVKRVLDELGSEHEVVIVHCAPVLASSDVLGLLGLASGTVLVVRQSRTPRRDVTRAAQVIADARGSILGLVLTGVPKGELAADGYGPWPSSTSARPPRAP